MNKVLLVVTAAILGGDALLADTILVAGSTSFVNMPATPLTVPAPYTPGSPYWNGRSMDNSAGNLGVGFFLTDTGAFAGGAQPAAVPTGYLAAGPSGPASTQAPSAFSFLQESTVITISLLYTNAGQNYGSAYGTEIGIYDLANPSNHIVIYDNGTLWNPAAGAGGSYNANTQNLSSFTVNLNNFPNWGVYATTCSNSVAGTGCHTYYSNTATQAGDEGGMHQHFALFQTPGDPRSFYVGFEDRWGLNGWETGGDYNDAIFRITTYAATSTTPEPATFGVIGAGLVALALVGRRRKKA
jgi:hypothetical protein